MGGYKPIELAYRQSPAALNHTMLPANIIGLLVPTAACRAKATTALIHCFLFQVLFLNLQLATSRSRLFSANCQIHWFYERFYQ